MKRARSGTTAIGAAIDSSYVAFVTFTLVLVVTPGSTTAVVVRNTLEGGRRAGYLTALGAALANSTIATACGLGLSVLLAVWPGSLDVIRIGGALFLMWLGASSLYRAASFSDGGINLTVDLKDAPARSHAGAYVGDGLAINLLSPVVISFYLSVVPSFIPAGAPRFYYSGLAATHVSMALATHSLWATALDLMRRWFVAPWTRRALQTATGLALIGLALRVLAGAGTATPVHAQSRARVAILAELFTSEGCDSCPPADRLLQSLLQDQPIDGVEIIALSEHVTYWDQQGWKDPFDSQQFTQRQQQYGLRFNLDSIYTPQLIIDGSRETVGSDRRSIEKYLRDAAKDVKSELHVHVDRVSGSTVDVSARVTAPAREQNAELMFALAEDHLSVDVKRGENANKTLTHSGVVRVLQSAGAVDVSSKKISFTLLPEWNRQHLRVVSFLQSRRDRRVLAVGSANIDPAK